MENFCVFNMLAKLHGKWGWDQGVVDTCNAICAAMGHEH